MLGKIIIIIAGIAFIVFGLERPELGALVIAALVALWAIWETSKAFDNPKS